MITKMKQAGVRVLLLCMLMVFLLLQTITAMAADGKISFTDLSVTVGEEFSIRVKIAADSGTIARSELILSYDASALEFVEGNNAQGGAGTISLSGTAEQSQTQVYTLTFKALKAGDTSITVNSQEVYDADENVMNITHTGSSAIKVTAPASYSTDASLKSLQVSPGTLTPAFSADVTEYSVEVGTDATQLIVNAVTNSSSATTSLSGTDLTEDETTVICKVTAEDGQTTREYSINVTKVEGGETISPDDVVEVPTYTSGDMSATIDGVSYEVQTQFDESTLPEGFEAITTTYHDVEVRAGQGLQKDVLLMYLKDADGNGGLYMYDAARDSFSPWVEISVSSKSIAILPLEDGVEIPVGFVSASIDVNIGNDQKRTVTGWVWESDEEHEYCVFYGMNWNGEKGLYRYDFKEMTLQRYFQDPAVDTGISHEIYDQAVENYNSLVGDYNTRMVVVIVLAVVVVLLLGMVITLAVKLARSKEALTEERGQKEKAVKQENSREQEELQSRRQARMMQAASREEYEEGEDESEEDSSDIYGMERNLEDELAKDVTEVKNSLDEEEGLELMDLDEDADAESDGEKPKQQAASSEESDEDDDFDFLDLDEDSHRK
ncbi:MAG: cadherin-like beta sandwich domain-containing protein [bacterium]|nr:cadherin-like beta sandwich domain-containing protein [bacterium]